uniref:Nuclear VCP like n=1 Tax=Scleropages formosus TaxID=113540 RepID=A0A8C9S342_SCLFO
MKNRSGSGVDKRLRQRVEQYLSTHDSQYVDLVTVAADLQKLYRMDYGRRNKTAFRIQVEKVYGVICGESGIVGLENKHLAKRFTNHMNNSLMSLYRKGAPESGTPQREKPTGGSVANSTAVSATKVSSGGWFIDKGRGAEDDNILIDLCEEDAGSPVVNCLMSAHSSGVTSHGCNLNVENALCVFVTARTKAPELQHPSVTFEDIGGNEEMLKEVCKLLIHMRHPEVYQQLGVVPPRGFLLHGPPGCGKTLLAHAVAGEMALPLLKVSAPELVSGVSGESEQKLRELFEQAVTNAPCILFIDEIDAITPKREVASKDMERRIVAQLLTCMDDLNSLAVTAQVLVIGATNRPDSLDPALRRAGRFDREVCLGIPDEGARLRILKTLCRKLTLPTDFDFQLLARLTPGYVGADLMALCREAAMNAVNRALFQLKQKDLQVNTSEPLTQNGLQSDDFCLLPQDELCSLLSLLKSDTALSGEQLSNLCILMSDFQESLSCVQPSAKREGFATVPDVTWADIGALQDIREELTMAILAPVRSPEQFKALGLTAPAGVLLAGPPGCGKTLLAKAVANESGLNFISVKGPELLNMYVGESERAVRQIDALCPRRSGHESGASVRVVNQLLTEMDGLETRRQVFIMAATNRPDIIDPAVLRPGRLDKTLYVGLPLPSDRHAILLTVTKGGMRPPLEADVNLEEIAYDERCDYHTFSSNSVVDIRVSRQNFEDAFKKVRPSVSKKVS